MGSGEAEGTVGSDAYAVLQPNALPVGLDTEDNERHLKPNQITTKRHKNGAAGEEQLSEERNKTKIK